MSNPAYYYEHFYPSPESTNTTLNPRTSQSIPINQPPNLFNQWYHNEGISSIRPRMDLHEDDVNNLVTASFEMPGVGKDDVQLKIQNDKLTVSAESKLSVDHAECDYAIRERRIGKFFRSLLLPPGTNESHVHASMEDGVLMVTFPKVAASAPTTTKIDVT